MWIQDSCLLHAGMTYQTMPFLRRHTTTTYHGIIWKKEGSWGLLLWGSGCLEPYFMTSAVVGGEWSASRPPGKEPPVLIGYEIVWTPKPVWTTWRRENSWHYQDSNSDPSVVQPVAQSLYAWAIPDLGSMLVIKENSREDYTCVSDFIHCINTAIPSSGTNEVDHVTEYIATSLNGEIKIHVNPILYRPPRKTHFSVKIQVMSDVHVQATSRRPSRCYGNPKLHNFRAFTQYYGACLCLGEGYANSVLCKQSKILDANICPSEQLERDRAVCFSLI
jgi:hypothetical protein